MSSPIPKVICHMLASVDGKLLPDRYSKLYKGYSGEYGSSYYHISDSYNPNGVLVGSETVLKDLCTSEFKHDKSLAKSYETYFGKRETKQLLAVFDSRGRVNYNSDKLLEYNLIAVLGENVSENYLAHLREVGVSYLFAGHDGHDFKLALQKLYNEFGMKIVSLFGGATINGIFLKQKLIDEISIIVAPAIDGLSGIPSIFEYKGSKDEMPAEGQSLELLEVREIPEEKGSVLLRYKVHKE